MEPITLFYPMLALVLFTFLVGFRLVALRYGAVKSGAVKMSFFRACLGSQPEELAVAQRAYGNLFETPPLFYVICALMIALRHADTVSLALAWSYVGARIVQGLIHLGYNNVRHRMFAYMASMALLFALWVRFALYY